MKRLREEIDDERNRASSTHLEVIDSGGLNNNLNEEVPSVSSSTILSDTATSFDDGHRYGNYHNYYTFHPVSNRTKHLDGILNFVANQWTSWYIGCNEGDLTLEIARLLSDRLIHLHSSNLERSPCENMTTPNDSEQSENTIHCTGLDLDADLIRRAQIKVQQGIGRLPNIQASFRVVDVLKEDAYPQNNMTEKAKFEYATELTTMFSTTMWIHIHGGDDGLRRVLQHICSITQYWILLEPQPSKCYGRAAFRLRRLGHKPIDVSTERLRLRLNIDDAIESILKEFNFEHVSIEPTSGGKNQIDSHTGTLKLNFDDTTICAKATTQWNRTLRLYQRVR
jgi:Bicoid-interacting protein 3 (Bin3)